VEARGIHGTWIPSFLQLAYDANFKLMVIRYANNCTISRKTGFLRLIQQCKKDREQLLGESYIRKVKACAGELHLRIL
jgi:hypothetical protein